MMFKTKSEKIANVCIYIFVALVTLTCALPIIHILAVSLSAPAQVAGGRVNLLPVGFTFEAYLFAF